MQKWIILFAFFFFYYCWKVYLQCRFLVQRLLGWEMRTPKVLFNVVRIPSRSFFRFAFLPSMYKNVCSPIAMPTECVVPIYFFISPIGEKCCFHLHFSFIVMSDCEHVLTWLSCLFPFFFFFLVNCLFIPAFLLDFYTMSFNVWLLCILVILLVVYTSIFFQFFIWLSTSLQFLCTFYVAKSINIFLYCLWILSHR